MNDSICTKDVTLRVLLQAINSDPAGTAFVVDNNGKLCGIVTDGDFRRMLLDGKTLDDELPSNQLGDFVYANVGESIEDLFKKTDRKVRIIPIVNNDFELLDYFRYDHRVHMPVAEPDLKGKEYQYLSDAFLSTWISSSGKYINRFEDEFAAFIGCKYGISTSNGTTALHLALKALKIGQGDEVIIPDFTFAATANAVIHANATPVLVDIEPESWCIDPAEIIKAVTKKTKAIIPVHIYGQPCNMKAIMEIAKKYNLYVIEDVAEAHGATYAGKKAGSFGDISCFSFFGNKILTTGEGGMCLCNDKKFDERMRMLRDHGMSKIKKYWHEEVGFNYRMTNMQAAVGCAQLERIQTIIDKRKRIEEAYKKHLTHCKFIHWQPHLSDREKVTWLVCLTVDGIDRDEVLKTLKNDGIDARPFFYPLSSMEIYKQYSYSNKNSIVISGEGLSLPTIEEVDFKRIADVFERYT